MPVADVLANGAPGDVRPGPGLADAVCLPVDDGDELGFPVGGVAADLDVVVRAGQRGGNLVNVAGTAGTLIPDSAAWLR